MAKTTRAKSVSKEKAVVTKKPAVKKTPAPKNPKDNPFTLLDSFWNEKEYETYSNYERNKNYYILQRRFAINFPEFACVLSRVGINGGEVVNFWKRFITMQLSEPPDWTHWLKTKAGSSKESTTKTYKPSEELVKQYCELNGCSRKTYDEAMRMFPDELQDELKSLEKLYK